MLRSVPHGRKVLVTGFAVLFLLGLPATSALADEQASGQRTFGSAALDGFRGRQGIRTDPATVTGVGYAHPTQMGIGSLGAAFLAVGTHNGLGTSGHAQDCANSSNPLWSVYVDGELAGAYFCEIVSANAYGADTNPAFRIEYGFCPSVSANRWLLSFGGTLWRCKSSGATGASFIGAGLETIGSSMTDRNIDVKYTNMEFNLVGFSSWASADMQDHFESPNYSHTYVSPTAFNVFLAPLN
jgi:hypothetical protein